MIDKGPTVLRPEAPTPRALNDLVARFGLRAEGAATDGVTVTGVSLSTQAVRPGDLYAGLPGARSHGASYSRAAADAGAHAVLTDDAGLEDARATGLPVLVAASVRPILGAVSAAVYGTENDAPQLFAVTGTNGKTSTVYVLDGILRQLGVPSGLSSTAERRIGDVAITSSLTTPEAPDLHALLARMTEAGVRAAAVEVSAQALSRHRVDGIVFDVAGFTNLSHDHLDDYVDFDHYLDAKAALFQPERARRAVITVDSAWGRTLATRSGVPTVTLTSDPGVAADWRVTVTDAWASGTSFRLTGPAGSLETTLPLLGGYMAANAALAVVMLVEGGVPFGDIERALTRDGGIDAFIPGRAEQVSGDTGPLVLIDYGHSPDAFSSTLSALRGVVPGRIVMVFGADGDRDATKRTDMGAIAATGADVVVITDFHPRFEDPAAIRRALIDGARGAAPDGELYEEPDPAKALRLAVSLAQEGDAVLYAGPGHEDYHEVAGEKIPYSARDEARAALRDAGWSA